MMNAVISGRRKTTMNNDVETVGLVEIKGKENSYE